MKTINYKDKIITFVPTAHVSQQSVEDVKETIELLNPDTVCIELDAARAYTLLNPNKHKDINIRQILKEGKAPSFLANLMLSSYQKRLADDLGTKVGGEMIQAIESGKEIDARIEYIDRDINTTMKRLWGNLSLYKKASIASTLIFSVFETEEFDEATVEDLKQSDLLFEAMKEFDDKLPEISQQILHERNYYMAEKLKRSSGKNIVCVIGAAHLDGIIASLEEEHVLSELTQIPPKKKNYWSWIIPITLIILIGVLTIQNPETGLQNLLIWLGLASGLALVGSVITLAHPVTALVGVLTAPISVLSPVLAVGMFTGITQAYFTPPTVHDFETISEDITKPKRWYKNKLLKVLMVALVTNLLVAISTLIAGSSIITSLFS